MGSKLGGFVRALVLVLVLYGAGRVAEAAHVQGHSREDGYPHHAGVNFALAVLVLSRCVLRNRALTTDPFRQFR